MQYVLTRNSNNGSAFVAVDKPATGGTNPGAQGLDNSLNNSYQNAGNQGKRANSTQSDQLKRSKINAS